MHRCADRGRDVSIERRRGVGMKSSILLSPRLSVDTLKVPQATVHSSDGLSPNTRILVTKLEVGTVTFSHLSLLVHLNIVTHHAFFLINCLNSLLFCCEQK